MYLRSSESGGGDFFISNCVIAVPRATITRAMDRASASASSAGNLRLSVRTTSDGVIFFFARNPCDFLQASQPLRW